MRSGGVQETQERKRNAQHRRANRGQPLSDLLGQLCQGKILGPLTPWGLLRSEFREPPPSSVAPPPPLPRSPAAALLALESPAAPRMPVTLPTSPTPQASYSDLLPCPPP
ncbi:protein enabled homolog isoform X1 [Symphalangus syndactylus]|uniref:protein enabled homolog isoform X1 n=1 Tax=Symphalangus syndactylus TaxID=9590 RepID=UPI0030048AA1